jgi:hypothetical protein
VVDIRGSDGHAAVAFEATVAGSGDRNSGESSSVAWHDGTVSGGDDLLPIHMAAALSYEVDAAANLLARSVSLVREFRYVSLDADPLLACLAIGVEKVTKLTLGLASIEETGRWPDKSTMKGLFGHRVATLDRHCRDYVRDHLDRVPSAPYIRRLLASVETDDLLALVMTVLDRYGTQGRFYNLDALAETPQLEPAPRELWEDVERAVWKGNDGRLAKPGGPRFNEARLEINNRIADSIDGWWELYFRAWINGVMGPHARQWSARLRPSPAR